MPQCAQKLTQKEKPSELLDEVWCFVFGGSKTDTPTFILTVGMILKGLTSDFEENLCPRCFDIRILGCLLQVEGK